MPKLRQKTTGDIFPMMPGLVGRDDMEIIEDDVPAAPEVEAAREEKKAKPKAKKKEDIGFKVVDELDI